MLADYSFKGNLPEKRGDLGIPTIPCAIKKVNVLLPPGGNAPALAAVGFII
jgi:hypothetical protein